MMHQVDADDLLGITSGDANHWTVMHDHAMLRKGKMSVDTIMHAKDNTSGILHGGLTVGITLQLQGNLHDQFTRG